MKTKTIPEILEKRLKKGDKPVREKSRSADWPKPFSPERGNLERARFDISSEKDDFSSVEKQQSFYQKISSREKQSCCIDEER